jgi:signal transduction histidine kinase
VTVTVGPLEGRGFYVADDGPGIPATATGSGSGSGSGSGLSIVRELAGAHGWTVTVAESEAEAGGTRVEIDGVELGS